MKIHSDILILELLKLIIYVADTNSVSIANLKQGFNTLIKLIEKEEKIRLSYDFDKELISFLDEFEGLIDSDGENINITADVETLHYNILEIHHYNLTDSEREVADFCLESIICEALGIKLPFNETVEFLTLNSLILKKYLKLGENELHNIPNTPEDFKTLKSIIEELKELINDASNSTLAKLNVCFNWFDRHFISDPSEPFINSPWYIILFSYNHLKFCLLRYDRSDYYISTVQDDEESSNDEAENTNDVNLATEIPNLDEISTFLSYFLVHLNTFLKENPNILYKEALLVKKYLLISIPELSHIEEHFLEHYTIDDYTPPVITEDTFTEDFFQNLLKTIYKCTTGLNIPDIKASTRPHLYASLITYAIFIKTYLNLSLNHNIKEEIIQLVANSTCYKNPQYKIATSIIDSIIFSDNLNLKM